MFFFGIGVELKGHLPAEDGDGRLETLGPLGSWMIWALPGPLGGGGGGGGGQRAYQDGFCTF